MLVGGWRYRRQEFDRRVAGVVTPLCSALVVIGMAIPSLLATVGEGSRPGAAVVRGSELHQLSIGVALILLACYAAYLAYLVFGLRASHEDMPHPGIQCGKAAGVPHNPAPSRVLEEETTPKPRTRAG